MEKNFMERFYGDVEDLGKGKLTMDFSFLDEDSFFNHVNDMQNYIDFLEICCEHEGATYDSISKALEDGTRIGSAICLRHGIDYLACEYVSNVAICSKLDLLLERAKRRNEILKYVD